MDLAPPQHPSAVVDDNIQYLQQAVDLLATLDGARFTHTQPPIFNSGIGGHFRHCIDHYECLLDGIPSGAVNYDHRDRDARLEVDVAYAQDRLCGIIGRLAALSEETVAQPIRSAMDCGTQCEDNFTDSCIKRELQFLISHTIHHYALIAMMLRHQGVEPQASFGVAPSTLRHRERQSECAQ